MNPIPVRVGVDFGYRWTGLAVQDAEGNVLAYRVVELRNGKTDLSETLTGRRTNRAQRRRAESRRRRLRDFAAFLKGIGLAPHEKPRNKSERDFIGNRLYALAHHRGWDYADLTELLVEEKSDGALKKTMLVNEIDRILITQFDAPQGAPRFDKKHNRYWPTIARSCLDFPAQAAADAGKDEEQYAANLDALLQRLRDCADNKENLSSFITERLEASGVPAEQRAAACMRILVELGVQNGRKLFEQGLLYTPHRNRHRSEVQDELKGLLQTALQLPQCQARVAIIAQKRNKPITETQSELIGNAQGILEHAYREKRFLNRSMGKCPVNLRKDHAGGEERCNCNLAKSSRPDLRRLQFEIEARQMNVQPKGQNKRNLAEAELAQLLTCVTDYGTGGERGVKTCPGHINEDAWKAFFQALPTPRVKDDARGKKEILRDLILGEQSGRSALCKKHLEEKLSLLKTPDGTRTPEWAAMHAERVLTLDDAPPSIRQKLEVTARELSRLLDQVAADKAATRADLAIQHIGLETARFDIRALASNEGRKLKSARSYQEKAESRELDDLRQTQNNRCFYCGGALGGDATVDHVHARALGGADTADNRVAAHRLCNIEKNRGLMQPNADVLALLPDAKRRRIERILVGGQLPDDPTTAAQHTQFGAKLLKGVLTQTLGLQCLKTAELAQRFKRIPARETDYLRSQWFPHWHHQKRALRAKEKGDKKFISFLLGETRTLDLKATANLSEHRILWGKRDALPWVRLEEGKLVLTPPMQRDPNQAPPEGVYNLRIEAVDASTGEVRQESVRFAVLPAEDDPIRVFHHALDAIVLASDVDWARFIRLDGNLRPDHPDYQRTARKALRTAAPKLPGLDPNQPPPHPISFVEKDSPDSSRRRLGKTDTQPLRVKGGRITQRKAPYQITLDAVQKWPDDFPYKASMLAAFAQAQAASEENRKLWLGKIGQKPHLHKAFFLSLDKAHPLHPHNIRGIRLQVGGVGIDQMFYVQDRKNGARHAFKRLAAWDEVRLFQKGRKTVSERFKNAFYVNAINPQTQVPAGATDTGETFKRGDVVKLDKKPGLWRISKLGDSATLVPKNIEAALSGPADEEAEITSAYAKLDKA